MASLAPIVLVIADLDSGGAQRVLVNLAKAWVARGRQVTVITLDDGTNDFFPLDKKIARRKLGLLGQSPSPLAALAANLRRVLALRRAVRESGAAIVISFIGATNILTILACQGLGKWVIVSERNDPTRQSLGRAWDWLRRKLYGRANLVTTNSRGALEAMSAFVPTEKLVLVPNPLVVPEVVVPRPVEAPTILAMGRLVAQKGYDLLLEAFAQSETRHRGWRLAILGEGPLRNELGETAERLGIADRVDWHGRSADPFGHLASAEVFVLASRFEGLPNAMLEAMAMGLPVIVTETSGDALQFVEPEVSGLVVPTDDTGALAQAIDRLASDETLRQRLGRAGKERVGRCSIEPVMAAWEALL